MDHPNKKSIRKHKPQVADQTDLTDTYRTFHLKAAEYTFFSSALGTSSRIDHRLGHRQASVNLRKLKSCQVYFPTTCFVTRNQLQEKNKCKNTNTWRLNNMLRNNQWITEEIRESQNIPRDK